MIWFLLEHIHGEDAGQYIILVRFATYRIRDRVIRARNKLKTYNRDEARNGIRVFVNEDLTKKRLDIFYQARKLKSNRIIEDTWTWDGIIRIQDWKKRIHAITRLSDLEPYRRLTPPEQVSAAN